MAATKETLGPSTLSGLGTFGSGTLSGGTPAKRWMVPGWCGCCSCTYFLDKYTRADSTDLGGNWTESAEDWSIDQYRLICTSGNGLCLCDVEGDDDEHVVSASVRGMSVGDQARLISSKILTEDSYWFLEVTWQATTATLELYQRTTGSNTQRGSTTTLYNISPGIPLHLRICFGDSTIAAQYRRDTGDIFTTATSYAAATTDSTCGVGTGTVNGEVRFDDFRLERHGSVHPQCPTCAPDCYGCTGAMPDEFLIAPVGPIGGLSLTCQRILPVDGYVLRRMENNPCFYLYDLEPAVQAPVGGLVQRVFLSFFGNTPTTTRVWVGFFSAPGPPLYYSLWHKYITPMPNCGAFSDETGFQWEASGQLSFGGCPGIDWEVTAL
ncbi:MAG: hypothetical protein ACYSUI_07665 [Planctomycetota bacterium]